MAINGLGKHQFEPCLLALGASSILDLEALEGVDRHDIDGAPECAVLRLAQKRRLLHALNRPRPKPSPPPAPPPPPYAPGFVSLGLSLAAPLADTPLAGWLRQIAGYAAETRLGSVRPSSRAHASGSAADGSVLGHAAEEATWEGEDGALGSAEVSVDEPADQPADRPAGQAVGQPAGQLASMYVDEEDDELDEEDRIAHDELRARALRRRLQAVHDWNLRM